MAPGAATSLISTFDIVVTVGATDIAPELATSLVTAFDIIITGQIPDITLPLIITTFGSSTTSILSDSSQTIVVTPVSSITSIV